jgi:hypothetical protein
LPCSARSWPRCFSNFGLDFLVNKEKVYCSRTAIHRGQQAAVPPVGAASYVLFALLSHRRRNHP